MIDPGISAGAAECGPLEWRAGRFCFRFPRPALVMGILNVTPDSFSDGGRFATAEAAVAEGLRLVAAGADILDVGGESTRPGAEAVTVEEELRRVMPVVRELAARVAVPISIDTLKPEVAESALAAGASIVNDVGAGRDDDRMWRVVAGAGAGYVAMHMQGTPRTMQQAPRYADVVGEVREFLAGRLARLAQAGVAGSHTVLDVGIGFGKTPEQNLQLLAQIDRFTTLGRPLLLGVSRKSFIGRTLGAELQDRLPASLACACLARAAGAWVFRVHDVAETVQALRMTEAILGHRP